MVGQAMPDRRETVANNTLFAEVVRLLGEGHTVTVTAKGSSMRPFVIGGRDRVVLTRADSVAPGDIVLARTTDGGYVLHRVYSMTPAVVELMGDGNLQAREICTKADICGKAVAIIRRGRRIDCDTPAERRKARLWMWLLPVRRYLLAAMRLVRLCC